LNTDASIAQKVEKLAEGKATIVEIDTASSASTNVVEDASKQLAPGMTMMMVPVGTKFPPPGAVDVNVGQVKHSLSSAAPQPVSSAETPQSSEHTLGQHETYGTFFRMLKMGVPREAVEQKMKRDGFITRVLDLGANAPVSKLVELEKEAQKTVGQEELYQKYFKMLKMGVPHPAVQQKMEKDGVNPLVLDLGENAPTSKLEELLSKAKSSSAGGLSTTKKKVSRQKTIRWDAIPEERLQKGVTIWHHVDASDDLLQFAGNDLENLFIKKAEQPQPTLKLSNIANVPDREKDEPKRKKSMLDARRAQSICIGMAKLKMSGKDYAKALVDLNEEVLSSRILQVIQGCNLIPNSEETTMLLRQTSASQLAEPDEFLYEVARACPDSAGRIEALTFRYLFAEIAHSTMEDAKKLNECCEQVRLSAKLKDLLRVVLLIGNQINSKGDGEDEKIRAFTLASLLKLSQTKSLNKTTTVLEYLVGFLMSKMPQVLDIAEELNLVNVVKRIDISALQRQSKDLKKGLDGVAQSFRGLEQFCDSAYGTMTEVENNLTTAKQAFSNVLDYFGEDQAMTSVDFFSTLSSFLVSFAHTKKELVEREKRNARKKQQQQQALQQQQKKLLQQQAKAQAQVEQQAQEMAETTKVAAVPPQSIPSVAVAVAGTGDVQAEKHPHLAEFLRNLE
jgi:hypothetical protein